MTTTIQNFDAKSPPHVYDDDASVKKESAINYEEAPRHDDRFEMEYSADDADFIASFPEEKRRKMYKKIDYRLIPVLALLYLAAYIDRANIGNAKIEGLLEDLNMTGQQYNICLSIFFAPYIIFEVPANAILHRFFRNRPSLWLGFLCTIWGIFMTFHGLAKNFATLCGLRMCLGVFEAGFFPGAVFIVSSWYPRHMVQTRIAVFYVSCALAGGFSGLLAYAIVKLDGTGGIAGWRFIFIIEGAATILIGLLVPFILIDNSKGARWLDDDEKRYLALINGAQDGSASSSDEQSGANWKILWSIMSDWQVYCLILIYWSSAIPTSVTNFTMPTIIKSMGYTSANAQLMTVPPYVVGAIMGYIAGMTADRMKRRAYPILIAQVVVCVGLAILLALAGDIKNQIGPCYFALCLMAFNFPIAPGVNAWAANNLAGPAKRAMGVAYVVGLANIGGIIGSYIFIAEEAPKYPTGYGVTFGFVAAGLITCCLLELTYTRINRNRSKISQEEVTQKYTTQQLADLGDKSPLYRYML